MAGVVLEDHRSVWCIASCCLVDTLRCSRVDEQIVPESENGSAAERACGQR